MHTSILVYILYVGYTCTCSLLQYRLHIKLMLTIELVEDLQNVICTEECNHILMVILGNTHIPISICIYTMDLLYILNVYSNYAHVHVLAYQFNSHH